MKFRSLLLLPLLLVVAACSGGEKFPYPPQFVGKDDISMSALGAPPAKYSKVYNAEINEVLARQAVLTPEQKQVIRAENHIAPEMIVLPVLGPRYTAERYPAMYGLLTHASSDAWRISDAMEDFWGSPRPWYADARVQLLVPAIRQPGYPSGHTTTNTVWAYVLSDLFPRKEDALFARAMEIGNHRIDGGAHFPHDVEGGRKLGGIIYGKMQESPQFQEELAAARWELRHGPVKPRMAKPSTPKAAVTTSAQEHKSWWSRHVKLVEKKPGQPTPEPKKAVVTRKEKVVNKPHAAHSYHSSCVNIYKSHAQVC